MIVPPTPGKVSWGASSEVMSVSMPADSSRPLTTIASDSCSVSNTLISLSLGSGRWLGTAVDPGIVPPEAGIGVRVQKRHCAEDLPPRDCNSAGLCPRFILYWLVLFPGEESMATGPGNRSATP